MNMNIPAKTNGNSNPRFTADQISLIQKMVCKGASADELKLFLYYCEKTGLDSLTRQIYAVMRKDKDGNRVMSVQTSIDGFRLIAERTGKYSGQVGPYWCGPEGVWQDVWLVKEPPTAAKVGILRSDFKEPCWGVARYISYVCPTPLWGKLGDTMISKCAESLGLRKAFPLEFSGLYSEEEMMQEGNDKQDTSSKPPAGTYASQKKRPPPPDDVSSRAEPAGKAKGSPPPPDQEVEIIDPEAVMKAIDSALYAGMDLSSVDTIWETEGLELSSKLTFPCDQNLAAVIYQKHRARTAGK